jgi:hypothetical protein
LSSGGGNRGISCLFDHQHFNIYYRCRLPPHAGLRFNCETVDAELLQPIALMAMSIS